METVADHGTARGRLETRGPVLLRDPPEIIGLARCGRVEPVRPAPRDDVHHAGQGVAVFRFEPAGLYLHLPDRCAGDAYSRLAGHHVAHGKPVHQDEHLVLPASPDVARTGDPGQSGQNVQKSAHGHPVEAVSRHAHRASGDVLLNGRGLGLHLDRIEEYGRGLEGRSVEPCPQVRPHRHAGDTQDAVPHDPEPDRHIARGHVQDTETAGCVRDRAERCSFHQNVDTGQGTAVFRVSHRTLEYAGGTRGQPGRDEQEKA